MLRRSGRHDEVASFVTVTDPDVLPVSFVLFVRAIVIVAFDDVASELAASPENDW